MKRLSIILCLLVGLASLRAAEPQRIFHDDITQLNDTAIILNHWPERVTYAAIELRTIPTHKAIDRLIWDYKDAANYKWADFVNDNSYQYDNLTDRTTFVTLGETRDNVAVPSETIPFVHTDQSSTPAITYALEVNILSGKMGLYIGTNEPVRVKELDCDTTMIRRMGVGCHGGTNHVEYLVSEHYTDPVRLVSTNWDAKKLHDHFSNSSLDPIEGFWKYLDRDNNPRYSRMGGEYQLAIVKNGSCYDIIYIGGASTNRDMWKEGMRKGHLTPTVFDNHYDLLWHDAMFEPMTNECSASLTSDQVLQLDFPLLKTTMRLVKCATDN